jgi:hypothetical protein
MTITEKENLLKNVASDCVRRYLEQQDRELNKQARTDNPEHLSDRLSAWAQRLYLPLHGRRGGLVRDTLKYQDSGSIGFQKEVKQI